MKIVLAAILFIFYIAGNPASIFSKDIEASPIRRLLPIQSAPSETAITTLAAPSNGTRIGNNGSPNKDIRDDLSSQTSVPSFLIDPGDYVLLVDKSTQKLHLFDGSYNLIKTFNVTTGQRPGDKTARGDLKTPEGIYFFTLVKDDSELLPEYGVMALPMNYPNYIDTIFRKKGNGIWLHATNQPTRPLKPFDTRGCVVAANEDVLELAEYIKLQTTPIVIAEKIEYDISEKINNTRKAIYQLIEKWKAGWESKDIDSYMNSYSKDFKTNGMDWQKWKRYKDNLNRQYKYISVSLSDMRILRHKTHMVVSFTQHYKNNKLTSLGIKRLYFVLEDSEWKIMGEEWSPVPAQKPAIIAKKYAAYRQPSASNGISLQHAELESPQSSQTVVDVASQSITETGFVNGHKKSVSSPSSPIVDIGAFKVGRNNKVSFKLINERGEQHVVSGRLAIVAENRTQKGTRYSSYPAISLEQGAPKDFREGEWFSIRRFKIVTGEFEQKGADVVSVWVYSKTGELLLHKEFPLPIKQ